MKAMREGRTVSVLMSLTEAVSLVALARAVGGSPTASARKHSDSLRRSLSEALDLPLTPFGFVPPDEQKKYEATVELMDSMFKRTVAAVEGSDSTACRVAGFVRYCL